MKKSLISIILCILSFPVFAADSIYYPVTATTGSGSHPNVDVSFDEFEGVTTSDNYAEYVCKIYIDGFPGWTLEMPAINNKCLYQGSLIANGYYVMQIQFVEYLANHVPNVIAETEPFVLATGSNEVIVSPAKVTY